ncbi:(5-formylfuran-3-yl)methyl phosphate synthase [Ideonella sp. YS5]|uniref:(5-formylfuran-3-yl)methyl phosphate synthase n=1 Tax=Ideonella sp. YS5 TaxID=3453714 RepID=UPI003EE92908
MRLLVSVRDVDEALTAARGGADFIDLKEPGQGALGGLPPEVIREIVAALRGQDIRLPVSATIGDVPVDRLDELLAQVAAVGCSAVDYVKVGIEPAPEGSPAWRALEELARCGFSIVPVFLADRGLDFAQLRHACRLGFPALMADTAEKRSGSLLEVVSRADIRRFVDVVRDAGKLVGLAGALRATDAPALAAIGPDFAGFRTAVCEGHRAAALDPKRLQGLRAAMQEAVAIAG